MSCPNYILKTFAHLAGGLAIAGVSAQYPILYNAVNENLEGQPDYVSLIFWIVLSVISFFFMYSSPANTVIKYIAAIIFVVILGQTSGHKVKRLEDENLMSRVFFLTTGVFLGMVAVGWYDKQNILKYGNYLLGALAGLLIAEIVLLILGSTHIFSKKSETTGRTALSFVGVGIFGLIAAQNVQLLKDNAIKCKGNADYITESLNFLLTYINIFSRMGYIMERN